MFTLYSGITSMFSSVKIYLHSAVLLVSAFNLMVEHDAKNKREENTLYCENPR